MSAVGAAYDLTEARTLLGRAAGERDSTARSAAARRCLEAFVRLVSEIDSESRIFSISAGDSGAILFRINLTDGCVWITPRSDGFNLKTAAKEERLHVAYNIVSGMLEGPLNDVRPDAASDEGIGARSAVAVLAEAVIAAVTQVSPSAQTKATGQ